MVSPVAVMIDNALDEDGGMKKLARTINLCNNSSRRLKAARNS
jgi:hypothetical protein